MTDTNGSHPREAQVQVRGWATPDYDLTPRGGGKDPGPSTWSLTFDTETTTTLGLGLRLVTYQVRKGGRLREQGIACGPKLTRAETQTVEAYAAAHGLTVRTLDTFLDLFFTIGVDRRGLIIGFNLPFDLSRIARRHAVSKPRHGQRRMRGGFTLILSKWGTRPTIRVRRVSARAAFIQFTAPEGRLPEHLNQARGGDAGTFRGYFQDVATLAGSLLGRKGSLKTLAQLLGVADGKLDITPEILGGPITPELLDYATRDAQVTWDCYQILAAQYRGLGLDTVPAHRLYSEASVAKAHLAQMGVRGWRETQPDVPDSLIATVMETYHGGRTETKIRRLPMPGVLTDVTSEYPTVFALQGLGPWLIADGVDWRPEDPAALTARTGGLTVEDMLQRDTWPKLTKLVHVQPGPGDLLPTRADYGGGTLNVALAHRVAGGPAQWFTLADVVASYLSTGIVPTIVDVLAFTPRGAQDGLRTLTVAGRHQIDPYDGDLISRLVELRQELKASDDPKDTAAAAAIKATVNSACYGAPIEVNTIPATGGAPVTVHRPDGTTFITTVPRVEEPGRYFHPLLATWTSGAGRLLLALIIRMVADDGGTYGFCDTDSVFVIATEHGGLLACPGGPHSLPDGSDAVLALSWDQVAAIVGRLTSLNPFGGLLTGKSILKIEPDNYHPEYILQLVLEVHSIASKRYALFTRDEEGRPVIVGDQGNQRRSEHGLGHLLPPTDKRSRLNPDADPASFYDQWWTHLLRRELGWPTVDPDWFDRPAVGRLTVTSPQDDKAFATYNSRRGYHDQIRPWNFGIVTYPTPGERARTGTHVLLAPLTLEPGRWTGLTWYDRDTPGRTWRIRVGDDAYVLDGAIAVTTYGDYFTDYLTHPEAKADGPDGLPCRPDTVGLLRPATIDAGERLGRIGKESNRVNDDTDLADEDDRPLTYEERRCRGCREPIRPRQLWCGDACRKRWSRSRQTDG